jgi:hypothetical protein
MMFPDSKYVIDLMAVKGEIGLEKEYEIKLPDTKVKGSIGAAWGGSYGCTGRLEPKDVTKTELVSAHDNLKCVYERFGINGGSERRGLEEGKDLYEGMIGIDVSIHGGCISSKETHLREVQRESFKLIFKSEIAFQIGG